MEGLDGTYAGITFSGIFLVALLALLVCFVTYFALRKKVERKMIFAVLGLFLLGYSILMAIILSNPTIVGIDGPFYIYEVGNVVNTGATATLTPPVVFYVMAGFSLFVGDVTLGVKIGQAFFPALMGMTTFFLMRYFTKDRFAILAVALVSTLIGAGIGPMAGAIKNTAAMSFAPIFYLFYFKFANNEGRKWRIRFPVKIRGERIAPSINSNLFISILVYFIILATHELTAGFVFMSVVAHVFFHAAYQRNIPWHEFKFVGALAVLMSLAFVSSSLRTHIIGTANSFAASYPIPSDLFPFTSFGSEFPIAIFFPLVILTLPAAWSILKNRNKHGQLLIAGMLTAMICSQTWILTPAYSFRFAVMMLLFIPVLFGISILTLRKSHPKTCSCLVAFGVIFSVAMLVGTTTFNIGPKEDVLQQLERYRQSEQAEQVMEIIVVENLSPDIPQYPGSIDLQMSEENIQEEYSWIDLSLPGISVAAYNTSDDISMVLSWYDNELRSRGWVILDRRENVEFSWGTMYATFDENSANINVSPGNPAGHNILVISGPRTSMDNDQGNHRSWGFDVPTPTNAISFNHNPLFAFILLPIELVQGLYGTWFYGVAKLIVAIPLTIGMIGLLFRVTPTYCRKCSRIFRKSHR